MEMAQRRTEYVKYTKEQLAEMAKFAAKLTLIGSWYVGHFEDQEVRWCPDGGIEVLTSHTPKD
jgi:hypothetical protein